MIDSFFTAQAIISLIKQFSRETVATCTAKKNVHELATDEHKRVQTNVTSEAYTQK